MTKKMCFKNIFFSFILMLLIIPLNAVTVNPALCPTNKIAPHRRTGNWNYQARTFGEFYNLLAPGSSNQNHGQNLLEEPQKDELEDCGEIEDYDENDLSSLTPHYLRRNGNDKNGKFFFGLFDSQSQPRPPPGSSTSQGYPQNSQNPSRPPYSQRPQYPQRPQGQYPQRPLSQYSQGNQAQYSQGPQGQYPQGLQGQYPQGLQRPQQTRPPYSSGGYFGNNNYRPQIQYHPSDEVKPVNEGTPEPHTTYRPHLVGGPVGHVVGATPVAVRPRPEPQEYDRYPQDTRRPTPRRLNNDGIIGSFIDLLFK